MQDHHHQPDHQSDHRLTFLPGGLTEPARPSQRFEPNVADLSQNGYGVYVNHKKPDEISRMKNLMKSVLGGGRLISSGFWSG